MRIKGLTRTFRGSHANSTPRETHVCPKRRPPRPQEPVFTGFCRGGLRFGHHTALNRGLTPPTGGNCTIRRTTRRRHADNQRLMLQNPHRCRYGERRRDVMGQAAAPVSGGRPETGHTDCATTKQSPQQEPRRAAAGIKLAQHTPSHRMCGTKLTQLESHGPTSGTKLSLLARNCPFWHVLRTQGELCTAVATKKPRMANFVPNTRRRRG